MELKFVRVIKRTLTCRNCEIDFFGYSEAEESAVALYECDDCSAIFSLPKGQLLESHVQGQFCPDCDAVLADVLVEKTQAGYCPMCEGIDYYGSGDPEEVELETYAL